MLFKKKGWLRNEFNEKLIMQMDQYKNEWMNQKSLVERSFEPTPDLIMSARLSEAKYFYLFREAKARQVTIRKTK